MKRKDTRKDIMVVLYQYQLLNANIDELIDNTFDPELIDTKNDENYKFALDIIHTAVKNADRYEQYINEELKDWTFKRLGYVEQAILLEACAEFDLKITDAAIIINEAVELAKTYCDDETYRLINGVLDNL